MAELFESRVVECPYHLAQGYLAQSLQGRAESGKPAVVTLSVQLPALELRKNVVVTYGTAQDPMHFDQPWRVHWTPEGGGPFPDFEGELTVRADEDYTTSLLELRGAYTPPGGAIGAAFDMVAGGRIATSTAQLLLKGVAAEMVARYRREEAEKQTRV